MFVLNGQLLSPFAPSSYFLFTLHRRENWTEMMGVVAGSSNLSSRQRAVCCYFHRWPLGLSTSTSVFHWCVFFCPSVLCFDQCGFTKTRKERTRRVGLHYHTSVWHKEGRTKVWFAGASYGSSTVSLSMTSVARRFGRGTSPRHTPSVHRGQGSCSHSVGGPPRWCLSVCLQLCF